MNTPKTDAQRRRDIETISNWSAATQTRFVAGFRLTAEEQAALDARIADAIAAWKASR